MLTNPAVQEILMDITNNEKDSISIIECILNGITFDLEIAEETDIKLNTIRKVLYKLNEAGIASYKKSQDPETKWFIYSWKFEEENVSDIITKKYEKLSEEIENPLTRQVRYLDKLIDELAKAKKMEKILRKR